MGLNVSVFRVRALSAIVFVLIMLSGLFWNTWSFILLFTTIAIGCLYEYQKLFNLIVPNYKNISVAHHWGLLLAGLSVMLLHLPERVELGKLSLHTVGVYTIMASIGIMLANDLLKRKFNLQNWAISFLGLLYIPMSFGLLFHLNFFVPILILASIWINDTMAYIVGSLIGRTPFSSISPKKTWEGTIGGAVLAIAVVVLLAHLFGYSTWQATWVSAIAAAVGTVGDLLESKLKRLANVKDSGQILPGHGGFLDRFDSLLLATPIVWIFFKVVHLF